jgi:AcrR family transcriptional regulator
MAQRQPARTRRPRGSLSQEEVIDAARRLIERDGFAALSMPGLAKELGAGTTSIYWYFRSREELLTAVAGHEMAQVYRALDVPPSGDWAEDMFRYFVALRAQMGRRRALLELISGRPHRFLAEPVVFEAVRDDMERWMSILMAKGLDVEEAALAYGACSTYTRGFVLREYGRTLEGKKARPKTALQPIVDPAEFPILASTPDPGLPARLDTEQFELGLRSLINGIRSSVKERSKERRKARSATSATNATK